MTIVVICPSCDQQTGEYRNGSAEIFTTRLQCEGRCPDPVPDDPLADEAMAHLAVISEED